MGMGALGEAEDLKVDAMMTIPDSYVMMTC